MSAPNKGTKLAQIHAKMCDVMIEALDGEPLLNDDNQEVLLNGKPVRTIKAGILKEVREFLKDNHIDAELTDDSEFGKLVAKVKSFDDDEPLFIPERDNKPALNN